eukprot:2947388-Rhodomonas_salina.3
MLLSESSCVSLCQDALSLSLSHIPGHLHTSPSPQMSAQTELCNAQASAGGNTIDYSQSGKHGCILFPSHVGRGSHLRGIPASCAPSSSKRHFFAPRHLSD